MKKFLKREDGITLIALVVTIIVLIILAGVSINLVLGQDGIIKKSREAKRAQELAEIKEKLGLDILEAQMDAIERNEKLEQSQLEDIISKYGELQDDKDTIILNDNKGTLSLLDIYSGTIITTGSYSENKAKIELLEEQIKTLQEQLEDATQDETATQTELRELKDLLAQTTATEDKILKDYTAYKDGALITGIMANNGTLSSSLNAGESYTIPEGYTSGGTIQAVDLASQTVGDATEEDIAEGKIAYVNGQKLVGTYTSSTNEKKMIYAGVVNNNNDSQAGTITLPTGLNADDIFLVIGSITFGGQGMVSQQTRPTKTYNADTGVLKMSTSFDTNTGYCYIYAYVYYLA